MIFKFTTIQKFSTKERAISCFVCFPEREKESETDRLMMFLLLFLLISFDFFLRGEDSILFEKTLEQHPSAASCILARFQERYTKTFKQYKPNPINENENHIVVFSVVT